MKRLANELYPDKYSCAAELIGMGSKILEAAEFTQGKLVRSVTSEWDESGVYSVFANYKDDDESSENEEYDSSDI